MTYKTGICSSCEHETRIYHSKNMLCFYCWKKSKIGTWSPMGKGSPIKKISRKGKETIKKDNEFYSKIWKKCNGKCEECNKDLGITFNKSYISHILSKGAYPSLRHNEKNINVLCFECHQQWEFGDRKEMRIYEINKHTINFLKKNTK